MRAATRLAALLAAVSLLFAAGCESAAPPPAEPTPEAETPVSEAGESSTPSETPAEPAPTPEPAPEPPPPLEATLVAIGDVMMHKPMVPGAFDEATGTYDFSGFFAPLRDVFESADWAVANLETPIAGDERGFPGYPMFNAPVGLADALAEAGFDVVSTANNHSLDQRFSGLAATLRTLRERGIVPVGTAETQEEADAVNIVGKKGVAGAFLSYTYGTNGIPIPKDKPFAVNLIDETKIAADIAKARTAGADFVAVSLHFGNEYQREPSDEQRRVARHTIESGADLVIGHHPHVVQPYERYRVDNPDGTSREGLIMYSLGNFVSNQFGDYKEYGAVLKVTFRKTHQADGAAVTTLAEIDAIPTWVHKYVDGGKTRYRVLSLDEITLESGDPLLTPRMISTLVAKSEEMNRHLDKLTVAVGGGQAPDAAKE